MKDVNSDFWTIVALSIGGAVVIFFAVRRLALRLLRGEGESEMLRPEPVNDTHLLLPATQSSPPHGTSATWTEVVPEEPRCLACGDVACEPMPSLERSRGARDWFRELFAMPPRYRRVVRADRPCLCRSHAHVADAMVDEFLHNRVRGAFTSAYTRVAVEAAGFEKEFLHKQLTDSLTEDQKRAAKKAGATVTRLLRTAEGG